MYLLPEDKNGLKLRTNCSSYKSSLAYHLSNVKLLLGCISFTSTFSNSEIWLLFIYQCSIINHHKIIFTIIWYNRWSQQLCILVLMSADTLSGLFIGLGFKNYAKLIPHMLKSFYFSCQLIWPGSRDDTAYKNPKEFQKQLIKKESTKYEWYIVKRILC